MVIKTSKLTKYYNKHRGIVDVDLDIKEGEIFGFIGPNGAGKSTTIRVLLNMLFKTSGEASIFGLDVENDSKEIKKSLGYVPSEIHYYSYMNVSDLLNFTKKFNSDINDKTINQVCKDLDLDKKRYIRELSTGNKKKVAIAQAIIRKPKLLILDEPTNGLDPLVQKKVFNLLIELKNNGTTIFLSSHNLDEVERYCDRVAIIKDGKILSIDKIEEIKRKTKKKVIVKYADGRVDDYIYQNNIKELLKKLSKEDIVDLELKNISLEENFIDMYEGGK